MVPQQNGDVKISISCNGSSWLDCEVACVGAPESYTFDIDAAPEFMNRSQEEILLAIRQADDDAIGLIRRQHESGYAIILLCEKVDSGVLDAVLATAPTV